MGLTAGAKGSVVLRRFPKIDPASVYTVERHIHDAIRIIKFRG